VSVVIPFTQYFTAIAQCIINAVKKFSLLHTMVLPYYRKVRVWCHDAPLKILTASAGFEPANLGELILMYCVLRYVAKTFLSLE
jgi:hypothetical protein